MGKQASHRFCDLMYVHAKVKHYSQGWSGLDVVITIIASELKAMRWKRGDRDCVSSQIFGSSSHSSASFETRHRYSFCIFLVHDLNRGKSCTHVISLNIVIVNR